MVKMLCRTQKGGHIELTGPPVPPGKKFRTPVDADGNFEAPADVAERLLIVLPEEVALLPGQVLHPEPPAADETWPPPAAPKLKKKEANE